MSIPLRVLIIEDSEEDTALVVHELHRGGYDPVHRRVDNQESLRAALAEQTWDIVLSDYNLPKFGGPAALKLLQERGLDLPFIIVSGVIGEDVAVEAMKAGAHDCIMKYNLKRLIPAVERELREAEGRRHRRKAEEEARRAEQYFRLLIENASDIITMLSEDLTIRYVSPSAERVLGYPPGELIGEAGLHLVHPDDAPRAIEVLARALKAPGTTHTLELRLRSKDGRWYTFEVLGKYISIDPMRTGVVLNARDITERKRAEEMILHMASYDTLTGLPNRSMLHDRLLNAIRTDAGEGKPLALLLVDLNHFKEINDTLGHDRGDEILKQVGRRLREAIFERDVLARPGGDEFSILLLNMSDAKDIDVAVQKILKALDLPFVVEGLPIRIEASIGITLYPDHGDRAEILFRRADIAMHVSKKTGNASVVYDPAQDKHSPQRLALMGELHYAIDHNELLLFYQPKINLKTRQTIGVEGLVRWKHPHRGMIPPDQFIIPAEQTGLIHPLTQWVMAAGMRQCKAWRVNGVMLTVALNLSARNLLDPKLPDQVTERLQAAAVTPNWMTFEITESAIMADPARALDILTRLHEMGIQLSIDDFGIGYSSLVNLQKLPVDAIKIDKSFVINMSRSQNDEVIVRSTIDLAHNLGLEVVAEGVETREVLDHLTEMGCDIAQGYYISKPIPAEQLTSWFSESSWQVVKS